jgi:hypothetical protein
MRYIESLLARDIMEDPMRRKLEDARDVKADHSRASGSLQTALYKMSDRLSGVRYTASVSQTGKETK